MIKVLLVFLLIFTSNCGFEPIYKTNLSNNNNSQNFNELLASIKIKESKTRLNQKLRQNLKEILNPNKINIKKQYYLEVLIKSDISGTFINDSGSSGRKRVTLNATYILKNISDNKIVATGNASTKDDFNVEDKRFANFIKEEEMELYLTKSIAQNIRDALINQLSQKQ